MAFPRARNRIAVVRWAGVGVARSATGPFSFLTYLVTGSYTRALLQRDRASGRAAISAIGRMAPIIAGLLSALLAVCSVLYTGARPFSTARYTKAGGVVSEKRAR